MHKWFAKATATCLLGSLLILFQPLDAGAPRHDVGFTFVYSDGDLDVYVGPRGAYYYFYEGDYYPYYPHYYSKHRGYRGFLFSLGLPGVYFSYGPRYGHHRDDYRYGKHKYYKNYHKSRHSWKHGGKKYHKRYGGHGGYRKGYSNKKSRGGGRHRGR